MCGITPCAIRVAMALNNQTIETEVHCLLAERGYQFTLAADVAGVADDRKVRNATTQFDGDMPLRQVAVQLFVVTAETTMDGSQTFQACIIDAFQCTDPKFEVRIYRVLHEHRDVHALQCIGYLLHGKRVGGSACTDPKYVDTCFQTFVHVLGISHFGSDIHACLFLDFLQPCQTVNTYTFETSRFGTRFPDSGTEYLHSLFGQLFGGVHYLFFCFGAARSCNDQRTFLLDTRQQNRFQFKFHIVLYYLIPIIN